MAEPTAVARQRIAAVAAGRREPADPHLQEAAAALLAEWWAVAERHGVTDDDLTFVTSMAATALDAVCFAERRRLCRGWSR